MIIISDFIVSKKKKKTNPQNIHSDCDTELIRYHVCGTDVTFVRIVRLLHVHVHGNRNAESVQS